MSEDSGRYMKHLMWRELLDASATGMAESKGTEQYERFRNTHLVVRKLYIKRLRRSP